MSDNEELIHELSRRLDQLEADVKRLTERLESTLEVNEMWDGS